MKNDMKMQFLQEEILNFELLENIRICYIGEDSFNKCVNFLIYLTSSSGKYTAPFA